MLKPRGQIGLEPKNLVSASNSTSSFWPRPRDILADAASEPATKRRRTSPFGNYRTLLQLPEPGTHEQSKQLLRYITYINSDTFDHSSSELAKLYGDFSVLQPLFDRLFCIPASSAPVERVFSQSGLNAVLESLVFLKCNADISCRTVQFCNYMYATTCLHCISGKPVTQAQH